LIPDNDDTGRAHMDKVAASLRGIADSIRILRLPGLPSAGDVSDWLADGWLRRGAVADRRCYGAMGAVRS
jgi:hypothetical protein